MVLKPGYFFVVDAEGAEVPGTRRKVDGSDPERERLTRIEMERGLGPGCSVEFREEPQGSTMRGSAL